jgi:hypothetical protein
MLTPAGYDSPTTAPLLAVDGSQWAIAERTFEFAVADAQAGGASKHNIAPGTESSAEGLMRQYD